MPIYEFICKDCGRIFEYLCIKSDDKDQMVCPSCGHGKTEMLLSTFASNKGSMSSSPASASCSSSGRFS